MNSDMGNVPVGDFVVCKISESSSALYVRVESGYELV
jgi:hypothetical protein